MTPNAATWLHHRCGTCGEESHPLETECRMDGDALYLSVFVGSMRKITVSHCHATSPQS